MKYTDTIAVTKKVLAQVLGSSYMEQEGKLAAIESGNLVDVGKDVCFHEKRTRCLYASMY